MDFNRRLTNYARLLIKRGINVQPGQQVNIAAEACQRELTLLLAEEAYKAGASYVNIDLTEPRLARVRILNSDPQHLSVFPGHIGAKYKEFVDQAAATIRLIGPEYPEILSDLDPKKVNTTRMAQYHGLQYFYKEGIEKSAVQWSLAAAATPQWGSRIFPELSLQEAESRLWDQIFTICRADRDDCLDLWSAHNDKLHARCDKLNALNIKTLHFKGPGTDLKVGLSESAIFKGGGDNGPRGAEFLPNIPTEECFTTPDWRLTDGTAAATRPFLVNGKLIKGLKMHFKAGEMAGFEALEGAETFREYISSDPGGKRLGEVALVGIDSPVYQSGLVFEEILYDENAACHIAVGSSYKFCLKNGGSMSPGELETIGANQSSVHTDMMISSHEVDVTAHCRDGSEVALLVKGQWQGF